MATPKNIQIPYQTLGKLIKICEEMKYTIGINNINFGFYTDLEDVLSVLHAKQESIELREAYGKLASANKGNDEDKKHDARMEYLKKRGVR
jgi:hypothetical protein